jgi:threonine/homoserine/homoserine lactone efflux protein
MDHPNLAPFLVASLLVEMTPGPNMAYLAALAATRGRAVGLAAVAGVALGLGLLGVAAGAGLAALVGADPLAYQLLRWAGVAYLLWLAWRTAASEDGDAAPGGGDAARSAFAAGLVTNLLNPKALLFYVAMLPGFTRGPQAPMSDYVVLGLAYVAVATLVHAAIVLLAARLEPWLADAGKRRRARRAFAGALVAIAAWFALSTTPQ